MINKIPQKITNIVNISHHESILIGREIIDYADAVISDSIIINTNQYDALLAELCENWPATESTIVNWGDIGFITSSHYTILIYWSKNTGSANMTIFSAVGVQNTIIEILRKYKIDRSHTILVDNFYLNSKKELISNTLAINSDKYALELHDEIHEMVDIEELTKQFLESQSNLLLLAGPPGTGKSSLIKSIIRSMCITKKTTTSIAYVKDERALKDPELWVRFIDGRYDAIIFDDLDNNLKTRSRMTSAAGNAHEISDDSFVNQLLSFSEGVLENNAKIIISTNQPLENVDSAVIRPGRCFDVLSLPFMRRDYAESLWNDFFNIQNVEFSDIFGDEKTIMQAHFMAEIKKAEVGIKSYLKDPTISSHNVTGQTVSPTIGFLSK